MLDASRRNSSVESLETLVRNSPVPTEVERESSRSTSPVTSLLESNRTTSPVANLLISCLKDLKTQSRVTSSRQRVRFNSEVQVMLIPSRSDLLKPDFNRLTCWNLSDLSKNFIHLTSLNDLNDSCEDDDDVSSLLSLD